MDISLNKIQTDIAKEARRFLEKECSIEYVREMFEDERGFTDRIWGKMTEMDWLGICIPEPYGGMGMDQIDLNIVLEEMGRVVLPGPYFSTVLLAAEAVMDAGSDSQKKRYLSGIATGDTRGTLALHEPDGGTDLGYIQMEARADGDGFVLNGTKLFVLDAHVADFVVCAARTKAGNDPVQGITLFLVALNADGVSVSLLPTMDGTRKLCAVDFKKVRVGAEAILGETHRGWEPLRRVLQRAQVGLCADSVGGAQRVLEMTTKYAKTRIQFDRPIGAFQAIKHKCAQMMVEVEGARSIAYYAAWAMDQGGQEAEIAASVAKAYCTETYRRAATEAIQIFGAIAITWEHDMHIFLKRAKMNELAFGDPSFHREQLARVLGY